MVYQGGDTFFVFLAVASLDFCMNTVRRFVQAGDFRSQYRE